MVSLFGKVLKVLPWLGAALVLAAVGLALHRGHMGQGPLTMIGVGFAMLLAMFLKIEAASLRYYLNLLIVGALLLGNLGLVYLLAANRELRWDLTRGRRYSLYPDTRTILRNLRLPVEIEVLALTNEPWRSYFQQYARLSDHLTFRITNPYEAGRQAQGADEEVKLNDIVVRSGERQTRIRFDAQATVEEIGHELEAKVASAILRVVQSRDIRLYFVSRHGEKTPEFMGGEHANVRSIHKFAEFLYKRAMTVRILDLQADRLVPDDCSMLAIVGPEVDYSAGEIDAIRDYLDRGGALLAMLEPPLSERSRTPRLRALLREYGIQAEERVVVDYGSYSAEHNVLVPLIHDFNPIHPITENLQGAGEDMPMTVVGPVEKAEDAPEDMKLAALIQTSAKSSLLEMEQYVRMLREKKLRLPPASEWRKIPLAATAEPKRSLTQHAGAARPRPQRPRPRIAVFGDADFLTDAQLGPMQTTLGYFTVNWLVGETDLVELPAPQTTITPLILGPHQRNLVAIATVVVLPFTVFFGGLAYTTIRRRKR